MFVPVWLGFLIYKENIKKKKGNVVCYIVLVG